MYMFEEFVEGVVDSNKNESDPKDFTSPDHRLVFMNVCVCNPHVTQADQLLTNYRLINKIASKRIRNVTLENLITLGCVV